MKYARLLTILIMLMTGIATAQNELRATGCSEPGKPALYETNEFGDEGWFPDDCDIARLEKNTPVPDVDNNVVTGTRICRWREPHTPEDLCYEFSHDGSAKDKPLFLRTDSEFSRALRMAQNAGNAVDVCLVNWRWGVTDEEFDAVNGLPPTACGVHTYDGMARCVEISTDPAPAGYSYCASRCVAPSREYRTVSIDNGACYVYVPIDLSFLDNPCWPLGCDGDPVTPPVTTPVSPPVNPPAPVDPPLCPPGTTDPICLAYQEVFDEESPDEEGYKFWEQHLIDNGLEDVEDLTEDDAFLVPFQNGCGVNHCEVLCSDPANAHLYACRPGN